MATRKPTAKDLESFRALLLHLRQEVSGDIGNLELDAFSTEGERASVDNLADVGSDSFAQEFSLELLQRDEATLGQIDAAIERLSAGTFGRCEECNVWIRKERLKAMPYAANCIDCQRQSELDG